MDAFTFLENLQTTSGLSLLLHSVLLFQAQRYVINGVRSLPAATPCDKTYFTN